jgi:drug/metabolite transporter (DMT)-like permease
MPEPRAGAAKGAFLKALALFLGAQFLFILVDTTGKYLMRDFPVLGVVWARYFFHFLFMAGYVAVVGDRRLLATKRPGLQLARGLTVFTFAIFLFAALKHLPQAEATAISFVAPLLILVLAGPLLGEHVGWARWAAAFAGFAGMLIIVRPGSGLATIGVVFAIATLVCNAAFQLMSRKLALTENPITTVFLSSLIGTAGATLLLPFGLPDRWPDLWQATLFLSFGVTGSVSHLMLMRAYRLAPASFIAPLIYLHVVQAMIAGLVFFGQFPDSVTPVGIAVILASGAAIAVYEQRRRA